MSTLNSQHVTAPFLDDGSLTHARVAIRVYRYYENDINNVKQKCQESPEFYRCLMYEALTNGVDIDDNQPERYYEIVTCLEELFMFTPCPAEGTE